MTFTSLLAVLTLAIISKDVNCTQVTDIKLIKDFIEFDVSKSLYVIAFLCWNKGVHINMLYETFKFTYNVLKFIVYKYTLIKQLLKNNIITIIYDLNTDNIQHLRPTKNDMYIIDLDCKNSSNILSSANTNNLFAAPYKWIFLTKNDNYTTDVNKYFLKYNFYMDSNINIVQKINGTRYNITQIYKYGYSDQFLKETYLSEWNFELGFTDFKPKILSLSRRNLHRTFLRASVVVLHNDSLHHLTDYRFKHIDALSKVNYIFTNHLFDFLNATTDYNFMNNWGYRNKDNTYSGMIGMFQRNETEIGGSPMFMTTDRIPVLEYIGLPTPTRANFIFRPPPLSYVANVFTLPFSGDVWLSSLALCVFLSILLYIAVLIEWRQPNHNLNETNNAMFPSSIDAVMVIIGAVAQQGTVTEPQSGAGRTIIFFTFFTLMFLYVSYSANIVALLQSSAKNIRTLEDLLHSRLTLGVDDNVYNRYYFQTATEPIRKAIYEKKVAPKGQKPNFMTIEEGVAKVKEGFFAFHGELGSMYKLVGDTFYENEKCGIHGIEYLQLVEPYMTIKKNSSYKEIIKLGFAKIIETGVQSRELQKLYTKKPDCHTSGGNFVSVGLLDVYFAFFVLGGGFGLSLLLFFLEMIKQRYIVRTSNFP